MILILSEEFDSSTNNVIDWIDYNNFQFYRINETSNIDLASISINNEENNQFILLAESLAIDSNEITSYWYRRGFLKVEFNLIEGCDIPNYEKTVNKYLAKENAHLKEILYQILENRRSIGKLSNNKTNKLEVLSHAKELGLNIPPTIITNKKKILFDFVNKYDKVITKSIKDNIHLQVSEQDYFMQYTNLIEKKDIDNYPQSFFPSIFQQMINKKFELRIFYLNNNFYTMAIFSQSNKQTEVDFRLYDSKKPNRTVPFTLSNEYKTKLQRLMDKLNLVSGSERYVLFQLSSLVILFRFVRN